MKNLRNSEFARFMAIGLSLIVTFAFSTTAQAQVSFQQIIDYQNSVPVAVVSAGDDTDTVFLIRYIGTGTSNSGLVAVAANGDLTFTQGVQGAEAASTEFECPISGALGGIIDVSDAACNTAGEVVDVINKSASWRAVIVDGMRSDVVDARILTAAATRATSTDGYAIKWDTSTAFMYTGALLPPELRKMSGYLRGGTRDIEPGVFDNTQTTFKLANATSTYGSGTSQLVVYSVAVGKLNSSSVNSETVTTIYAEPGGATTANKIYDDQAAFGGIRCRVNEKCIVRLLNSAAASSVSFRAYGDWRHQ